MSSVRAMSCLEFSLSKKEVDIFKLSYSTIGIIIFFGEALIVKWLYNNITMCHLKY